MDFTPEKRERERENKGYKQRDKGEKGEEERRERRGGEEKERKERKREIKPNFFADKYLSPMGH